MVPVSEPTGRRPLRIAILGTRGVPPAYGGFETFAGELSVRLVARGHDVTVYCRPGAGPSSAAGSSPVVATGSREDARHPRAMGQLSLEESSGTWRGVRRIVAPAMMGSKYFETVSHTFVSSIDAVGRGFDVILLCNAANAFVLPLLRSARIPVAVNVDGIERKRRKWNVLGRAVYAIGESFSAAFSSRVVADAEVIAGYYREKHQIDPVMIPYGAEFPVEEDSDVLARLGLRRRAYVLYVSRFEPENNPLEVVQAYVRLTSTRGTRSVDAEKESDGEPPPLVMLGSAKYAPELDRTLRSFASERILFPGALYGADYRTLQRNALLYIQATEVGGTHPAMIEAMASGGAVLAHDTPENREAGGDAVGYFRLRPEETLSALLAGWLADAAVRESHRARAHERAAKLFGWDRVTDAYENLFLQLAR